MIQGTPREANSLSPVPNAARPSRTARRMLFSFMARSRLPLFVHHNRQSDRDALDLVERNFIAGAVIELIDARAFISGYNLRDPDVPDIPQSASCLRRGKSFALDFCIDVHCRAGDTGR